MWIGKLGEVIRLRSNGVALKDICIVARTKKLVDDYIAQFTKAGMRSYAIKRNKSDDRSFDGLRIATMHRVKDLEFKYVFVNLLHRRNVCFMLHLLVHRKAHISQAMVESRNFCVKETLL